MITKDGVEYKVYLIGISRDGAPSRFTEITQVINRWLEEGPVHPVKELYGTKEDFEKYLVKLVEELGYRVTKD